MAVGLLLRDDEERLLEFDFEASLPPDLGDDASRRDFKRGSVVCRHWLRGLCMKGESCEFLHQYDMARMPECRWGMECQVPECPFRHVPDEERMECAFYKQGFCSHGPTCRYRHIKLASDECPSKADFSLQAKLADDENAKRRRAQPLNEFYKVSMCKHWEKNGTCPFGDECHFAHGNTELRSFPRDEHDESKSKRDRREHASKDEKPPPGLPDEHIRAQYFVVHSQSYHNLAHSVHYGQWTAPADVRTQLQTAYETSDAVFLFFTITPSGHFQGVARLLSSPTGTKGVDLASNRLPYDQWDGTFGIEWLRICECPWPRLAEYEHQHLDVEQTSDGQELSKDMGHSLLRLLFNQAQIRLHYKSVEDEDKLRGGAQELANRRRDAAESIYGGMPPPAFPDARPGFIFACTNSTIDECFVRRIFALAKEQESIATKHVVPGTPLFLLNLSDRHLLGVFEAASPAVFNMLPAAFTKNPNQPSAFPVQARFVVSMHAPAIPMTDPQVQSILGDKGQIGPLPPDTTQQLLQLYSDRCNHFGMAPKKREEEQAFREKIYVDMENDKDFNVTRRIIGQSGSNMKRISSEAGGNAKLRVRGRGSGASESTPEEAREPLMVIVSADNEQSFHVACERTRELLAGIRQEHDAVHQRRPRRHRDRSSDRERKKRRMSP